MTWNSRTIVNTVAVNPESATFRLAPHGAVLSPVRSSDAAPLERFFEDLSDRTRRFYSVESPQAEARSRCAAIARHDKICLVLRERGLIVALAEFSLDLVPADFARFQRYGVDLDERDCRWGLCVHDAWHRRGIGMAIAGASFELASRFGRRRVILWGGVQSANTIAQHFYRRVGFSEVGRFTNEAGVASIDMLRPLS